MNFGSIFLFYRFFLFPMTLLPAGVRIACRRTPADVFAAFERQTQGKNRAERTLSLPQFPRCVSLAAGIAATKWWRRNKRSALPLSAIV
jgi:hypothetical protein